MLYSLSNFHYTLRIPFITKMKVANRQAWRKPIHSSTYHVRLACFDLQLLSFPIIEIGCPACLCNGGMASYWLNANQINEIAYRFFVTPFMALQNLARQEPTGGDRSATRSAGGGRVVPVLQEWSDGLDRHWCHER
jgi:hypothetical protein